MKAAVMRAVGEPLTIEDVQIDVPGPHEVLIDVASAGLCHSDLRYLEGSYQHPTPTILGHESAGVVVATGELVSHVAPGDHVITSLSVFCGACSHCQAGRTHLCDNKDLTSRSRDENPRLFNDEGPVHQFLNLSSFAEKMLVHENATVRISERMPLDTAALLGCGVATGLGAVFNTAGVRAGETVAVIGCGGVGLSAVQGARIAGASSVIAIDRVPEKLRLAQSFGATHLIDASAGDPVSSVLDITNGQGVDHALEAVGSTATVEAAFAMTRRGGIATVVGLMPEGQTIRIPTDDLFYERKLQGSVMGSNEFREDTPRYVDLYLDGELNLDDMVTGRISLDQINQGFEDMIAGTSARSIITFEPAL